MADQSVSGRIFTVLDVFLYKQKPMTLSEVSDEAGLPMPTVYRYLRDLVEWGGLEKAADGRYQIGSKMWMLGSASSTERIIRREATPLISAVSRGLHRAVALTMLHKDRIICVERVQGADSSIYLVKPGQEIPLPPSGAGRVLLSSLEEDSLIKTLKGLGEERLLPGPDTESREWFTEAYDTTKLLAKVLEAREMGYAISFGELRPHQTALSVPVHMPQLGTKLALSILTPIEHPAALELLPYLRDAATALGKRLSQDKSLRD